MVVHYSEDRRAHTNTKNSSFNIPFRNNKRYKNRNQTIAGKVSYYLDLKQGDKLIINPGNLEIKVLNLFDSDLKIETPAGSYTLYRNDCYNIGGISLVNSGRRAKRINHKRGGFRGQKVHAKLVLPNKNYSFTHLKNQKSEKKAG